MWKWFNSFAQPEKAYSACNALLPYFMVLLCVCLPIGLLWGLVFSPTDYQQFEVYRIIYIHVPSASLSLSAYVAMAIAAFVGIVWQWRSAFMTMVAIAPIGAVITVVSLFTGAVWGKPTWGTYWIWDARLTSQLILLFLYLGVIALYVSFDDKQQGAKAAGIMAIVGVINIPIIKYSVEWWNTLHQGATISKFDKPSMPAEMLIPLLIAMAGMAGYIGTITLVRLKNELIKRDAHRPWVASRLAFEDAHKQPILSMKWWAIIVVLLAAVSYAMAQQGAKFSTVSEFLSMGGRGVYVWVSYSFGLFIMTILAFVSIAQRNIIVKEALKQKARVERIMAARAVKAAAKKDKALAQAPLK